MNALVPYQEELERNFRVAYLIGHFIQGNLSEEEEEELDDWIQQSDHNMQVFEDLTDEATVDGFMKWYAERDTERNLVEVKRRLQFSKPAKVVSVWRYVAAASILICIAGAYFIFFNKTGSSPKTKYVQQDIPPGRSSATLKLANGKQIDLTNVKDSIINEQVRIENGAVVYIKTDKVPEYHELFIPRKGFYQLALPDGSRVWLNSESSIKYPSVFTGNERRVSVTGETYFEVAKDAKHPFIVSVDGVEVTALGTAFNINAYPNENGFKATLTEGSIEVVSGSIKQRLSPGEQIVISDGNTSVQKVDVALFTAWTKNEFKLKKSSIEEVMRLAERWYDADIVFEGQVKDHFTGTISRDVPVTQFLKLLQSTGQVHFEVNGNKIIVRP